MTRADDAPRNRLLAMMLGVAQTQLLRLAVELRLPDRLAHGPKPIETLAAETEIPAPTLARLARALAGSGLLVETSEGLANTDLGALLRTDHPDSLADYARLMGSDWLAAAWPALPRTARTGISAVETIHGAPLYARLRQHPEDAALFSAAMTAASRQEGTAILEAADIPETGTIADIAGGQGLLLATLLRARPALHGILQELPHVLDPARAVLAPELAEARCTLIAGSFLETVPQGADLYLLKRVLIDCDDQAAHTLLQNLRTALPPGGRILIAEPDLETGFGRAFDLLMLLVFGAGSRLRPPEEMATLLQAAGLRMTRTWQAPPTMRLFEAVAA